MDKWIVYVKNPATGEIIHKEICYSKKSAKSTRDYYIREEDADAFYRKIRKKVSILKRMKNWRVYYNGEIAYCVIRKPKGFKIKPSAIIEMDEELTIYAYKNDRFIQCRDIDRLVNAVKGLINSIPEEDTNKWVRSRIDDVKQILKEVKEDR